MAMRLWVLFLRTLTATVHSLPTTGDADANRQLAEDGDCDGALTADDCDDTDAGVGDIAEDGDCDGAIPPMTAMTRMPPLGTLLKMATATVR